MYSCHIVRASATYAIGIVARSAARPKSPAIRIGLLRNRSTQTPAGSVKRMNGRKLSVPSRATSKALASSTTIATNPMARSSTAPPNWLIVSADHSFRKSGWRQSPPLRPEPRHRRLAGAGRWVPQTCANARACISPSASSAPLKSATRRFSRLSKRRTSRGDRRACRIAEVSFSTRAAISSSEAVRSIIAASAPRLRSSGSESSVLSTKSRATRP